MVVGLLSDSSNSANERVAKESPPSKMKLEVDVGDTPVNFFHSSSKEAFEILHFCPLFSIFSFKDLRSILPFKFMGGNA